MMRRVLVVDDEPLLADTLCAILVRHGFACSVAYGGEAALVQAGQFLPDTLLTDVMMPGMNGCELATGLTTLVPSLKVMFMSAYDRDFLVARGLQPCGPVITKPFTVEYLLRRVQMVLGDQRAPVAASPRPSARAR